MVLKAPEGNVEERPNPCPTPESVYHLTDLDWVEERFKDDFALKIMLAHANASSPNPEKGYADLLKLATAHGIETRIDTGAALSAAADALHTSAALYSSRRIVELIEAFAHRTNKRVLYVLTGPAQTVARRVEEGVRRIQPLVDFMRQRRLPFVDMVEAHVGDFARYYDKE